MSEIGNLGDIVFEVTQGKKGLKVLSFSDMQRSASAEFEEHDRNGKKAYLEFVKPNLDEISLTIYADANYRVKPLVVKNKLIKYKNAGTVIPFVLGGRKVGTGNFVITSVDETPTTFSTDGRPIKIAFAVSLKEYIKKKKVSKTTKSADTSTSKKTEEATKEAKSTSYTTYTVQKGDTLTSIAKKYYGKGSLYTKIYNANKDVIKNPNSIYAGQKIKIPK